MLCGLLGTRWPKTALDRSISANACAVLLGTGIKQADERGRGTGGGKSIILSSVSRHDNFFTNTLFYRFILINFNASYVFYVCLIVIRKDVR